MNDKRMVSARRKLLVNTMDMDATSPEKTEKGKQVQEMKALYSPLFREQHIVHCAEAEQLSAVPPLDCSSRRARIQP